MKKIYYGKHSDTLHTIRHSSDLTNLSSLMLPEQVYETVTCAETLIGQWKQYTIQEPLMEWEQAQLEVKEMKQQVNDEEQKINTDTLKAENPMESTGEKNAVAQPTRRNTMQKLEEEMIKNCDLWIYDGQIVRFNGQTYDYVDETTFITLARMYRPGTVEEIKSYPQFKSVIQYMLTNPSIELKESTAADTIIPFKNYAFDISDGSLHPYKREVPIFYKLKCRYTDDEHMPHFEKFLETSFQNDEDTIKLLYEIIGYIVCNGRLGKKWFLFANQPDSGKSQLANWLSSLFEDENTSSIPLSKLAGQFALGDLDKIRLNYCMELPLGKISDDVVAIIKQLTGDAVVLAERKFQNQRKVRHFTKFLFGTNNPIELLHDDEAFWNRVVLLPFCRTIPPDERDPNLLNGLMSESSQIVSKAARTCVELHRRNYEFTQTTRGNEMITAWRCKSIATKIKDFVKECCTITYEATDFCPSQVLYNAYCDFCKGRGEIPGCSVKQFSNTMRRLYGDIERVKRSYTSYANPVNGFTGICLKEEKI